MYREKDQHVLPDTTGRILSLEQRFKGLAGRLAAVEARLSMPESSHAGAVQHVEDFVPASGPDGLRMSGNAPVSPGKDSLSWQGAHGVQEGLSARWLAGIDLTGMIAGSVLIAAGLLLLAGQVEIIKNPLAALGCGILVLVTASRRKPYK
jgi:hypothetical protein